MTETVVANSLPHWDMTPYYPSLESDEFKAAVETFRHDLGALERLVGEKTAEVPADPVADFDAMLGAFLDVAKQVILLDSYIYGFLAVNSRDDLAQARISEMQILSVGFSKAQTRFTAWLGELDVESLIASSELAQEHAYFVRNARIEAEHLMPQPEEDLAAELTLSGGSAFSKLHGDLSSQIMVRVEKTPGEFEELPMSEVRNLAMDADRAVRRRAFEAEVGAWKEWATPIAASLNGVKGEHTTLAQRRNWDSALEQSLFQNHIDRQTLDAMMTAAREAFPDIRRYLDAKARALGVKKLAWYDIFAPLSANDRAWEWDEGVAFLLDQFGSFSPKLRGLAERAIDENWIDAEPRSGKVGGAFCMPTRDGESRVLSNYTPAFDGVSTLAHELGHAYHNLCQKDVSVISEMETPNTLAETASTFCETILRKAAIERGTEEEALTILEGALQDATQTVVDITSRFLFEQAVFERRAERELSADEFCELMLDAQRQTYGEGLTADELHPYMWAVKGHYYSPGFAYYNYPYMFGLLFGLGLYAKYQEDPDTFRSRYDDLLASTGSASAADLTARFGFDIRTPDFWRASLDVVRADIDTFVDLVDRKLAK
jgi:oligoendopeptidase F